MADVNRDGGVFGAVRGQHAGEVDGAHSLGLHRAEHDRTAQPTAGFVNSVPRGLRGGESRSGFGQ